MLVNCSGNFMVSFAKRLLNNFMYGLAGLGWLALVGLGWPWLALVGLGWPCLAMVGIGWPWLALVGLGWPWFAFFGLGWPRLALAGLGRPWLALAGQGCSKARARRDWRTPRAFHPPYPIASVTNQGQPRANQGQPKATQGQPRPTSPKRGKRSIPPSLYGREHQKGAAP